MKNRRVKVNLSIIYNEDFLELLKDTTDDNIYDTAERIAKGKMGYTVESLYLIDDDGNQMDDLTKITQNNENL